MSENRTPAKLWQAIILACLSFLTAGHAQFFDWTTIAGSAGVTGTNDGVGIAALFGSPQGIATDAAGNIFVADNLNSVIRQLTLVNSNWQVTTIAGQAGVLGSADGTNAEAQFSNPSALGVNAAGDVFVADYGNSAIRKLSRAGTNWVVTTIAGQSGSSVPRDGTNTDARFYYPNGLAVDAAGSIFVADIAGNSATIRKVSPAGSNWITTTIAGKVNTTGSADGLDSQARFQAPDGLAVGVDGTVYVADSGNCNLRALQPSGTNWVVTTIAGVLGSYSFADGTNLDAQFSGPQGIAVDAQGNLFVADTYNNTLREVMPQGTNWITVTLAANSLSAGTNDGVGAVAQFNSPAGICVTTNGLLYVTDFANATIRRAGPVPPPVIQNFSFDGTRATVTWSAPFGANCQLQFTTSLNPPVWFNTGLPQPAANASLTATDVPNSARCFYRVAIVP